MMTKSIKKRGLRLLIVDDDSELRDGITAYLARQGHQVEQCENGRQALVLAEQITFDVIVLDLAMPGICGLEVLELLKLRSAECEIVLQSGVATREVVDEAMRLGAHKFLAKPISFKALDDVVRRAYETSQMRAVHSGKSLRKILPQLLAR